MEEEAELSLERDRLRHQETLRLAAAAGAEAISPPEGFGVGELLAGVAQQLDAAAAIDPALAALSERVLGIRFEAEDLARELRGYVEGVEGAPGRLEEVEERLALFTRLQRKHGGSIVEVLRHAERCRARREELEHADVALDAAQQQLAAAQAQLDQLGAELSERRRAAALELAAGVRERLSELALADARFEVQLRPRPEGCGPTGADSVEFSIAPNAGLPAGPLREIASGGELSRVMLALLSVAHGRGVVTAQGRIPPRTGRSSRCWSSTRSTLGSAATPRVPWANTCASWPTAARSCASPTCPRSRHLARDTSRSSRTTPPRRVRGSASWKATLSSPSWSGCWEPGERIVPPASMPASC